MLAHRRLRKDARFALIWLSLISKLSHGHPVVEAALLRLPKGNPRKSRSRAKALVTSFVDVLLFSFQGSKI